MVRLAVWGHHVRELTTPNGVLHFRTDCSLLDEMTVLAAVRLALNRMAVWFVCHRASSAVSRATFARQNPARLALIQTHQRSRKRLKLGL